ncbi:MAG: protein TolQ [Thiohalomonadales bacterium]|nr:protein TolQ [Thiohalomonadales bacterium]
MSADLSVTHLISDASFVVQLVMLLLLAVSLLSWTIIFVKWSVIKKARRDADQFERRFWSGADLGELYKRISGRRGSLNGMESIFEAGFREFAHLRKSAGVDAMAVIQGAQRAMRVAMNREIDKLELHLSFLATVGSTSPYVGLFGTVWGIMNSFMALGAVKQATIASVAPGIAEALIATAMGLFAAIPAVIAYNRYSNDVERLVNHYDIFAEEFSTILQRQAHFSSKDAAA